MRLGMCPFALVALEEVCTFFWEIGPNSAKRYWAWMFSYAAKAVRWISLQIKGLKTKYSENKRNRIKRNQRYWTTKEESGTLVDSDRER